MTCFAIFFTGANMMRSYFIMELRWSSNWKTQDIYDKVRCMNAMVWTEDRAFRSIINNSNAQKEEEN